MLPLAGLSAQNFSPREYPLCTAIVGRGGGSRVAVLGCGWVLPKGPRAVLVDGPRVTPAEAVAVMPGVGLLLVGTPEVAFGADADGLEAPPQAAAAPVIAATTTT
jgi:hypothetical protein